MWKGGFAALVSDLPARWQSSSSTGEPSPRRARKVVEHVYRPDALARGKPRARPHRLTLALSQRLQQSGEHREYQSIRRRRGAAEVGVGCGVHRPSVRAQLHSINIHVVGP